MAKALKRLGIYKMAGVKGRSGTNKGKDKPYADALRRAIARAESSEAPHALDKIADKHLQACSGGDMQAIKELADRLDGKATQPISGDGETPLQIIVRKFSDEGGGDISERQFRDDQTAGAQRLVGKPYEVR